MVSGKRLFLITLVMESLLCHNLTISTIIFNFLDGSYNMSFTDWDDNHPIVFQGMSFPSSFLTLVSVFIQPTANINSRRPLISR